MKTETRAPGMTPGNHAAILAGRKTQTRRIWQRPTFCPGGKWLMRDGLLHYYPLYMNPHDDDKKGFKPRYGPVGITWALKEKLHQEFTTSDADTPNGCLAVYSSDGQVVVNRETGRPMEYTWSRTTLSPRHFPLIAARYFVTLEDIRVERVQDISNEDMLAEGLRCPDDGQATDDPWDDFHENIEKQWIELWDSINAKPKPVLVDKKIDHYISYPWEDVQETREHKGKKWHVRGNCWVTAYTFSSPTLDPGRAMPDKR